MNTCHEYQARLSVYLDGEAGDMEESIRAHIEVCDACRRTLDGFAHLSTRIRDVTEEQPAALVETIRSRIAHRGIRESVWIPQLAAAAVFLAALLWTIVLLGNGDEQAIRLADMARGSGLSEAGQRLVYGEPPADDEWMVIILTGGSPR